MSAPAIPRSNECYQAAVSVLEEHGVEYTVEHGGKHPALIFEIDGRSYRHVVPSSSSDVRAVHNQRAQVRRLLRDALNEEPTPMTSSEMVVADCSVPVVQYQGQRVVTFGMVDRVHKRPDGTAARTFRENRRRFDTPTDFVVVSREEARDTWPGLIGDRGGGDLIMLTRRGYLKIVKPMNDDVSWRVQGEMVDRYFAVEAIAEAANVSPTALLEELAVLRREVSDVKAATELLLESKPQAAMPIALHPPSQAKEFVLASEVVSRSGVKGIHRVRGASTAVTRALIEICGPGDAWKAPAAIDPLQRWRFASAVADEWLETTGRRCLTDLVCRDICRRSVLRRAA